MEGEACARVLLMQLSPRLGTSHASPRLSSSALSIVRRVTREGVVTREEDGSWTQARPPDL